MRESATDEIEKEQGERECGQLRRAKTFPEREKEGKREGGEEWGTGKELAATRKRVSCANEQRL